MFQSSSYDELTNYFLYTYYQSLLHQDGSIDKIALTNFLKNINDIAQKVHIIPLTLGEEQDNILNQCTMSDRFRSIFTGYYYDHLEDAYGAMGYVDNLQYLCMNLGCIQELNGSLTSIHNTFIPIGMIGINATSDKTEIAKDFVRYLYSEEFQSEPVDEGFPMNQKLLDQYLSGGEPQSPYTLSFPDAKGNRHVFRGDESVLDETTVKEVKTLFYELDTPIDNNIVVHTMILDVGTSYLKGEISLEQAVDEIVQKVNLYMKE